MNQNNAVEEEGVSTPKKRKLFHIHENEHLKLEIDQYIKERMDVVSSLYRSEIVGLKHDINELKIKVHELLQQQGVSAQELPTSQIVQCVICLDDCRDPAILIPCGHTYCYGCVASWLQDNSLCPTCRQLVERFQKIFV